MKRARARDVEVERVDVHRVAPLGEQIHAQRIGAQVLRESPHTIPAIQDGAHHLVAAALERERGRGLARGRHRCRHRGRRRRKKGGA